MAALAERRKCFVVRTLQAEEMLSATLSSSGPEWNCSSSSETSGNISPNKQKESQETKWHLSLFCSSVANKTVDWLPKSEAKVSEVSLYVLSAPVWMEDGINVVCSSSLQFSHDYINYNNKIKSSAALGTVSLSRLLVCDFTASARM